MRIYKVSDRVPVKIDDIEVKISPLTFQQKANVQAELLKAQDGNPLAVMAATRLALKYAVKEISGVENEDGSPYQVELENGELSEESVDNLLNLDPSQRIELVCMTLLQGRPSVPVDAEGKPLKGIKIGGNDKGKK